MTHALRIHEYGGPDVMQWEAVEVGDPAAGEVRLKQTAVGLNYIDVYVRTGAYPQPALPFTPGMEGAGEVVAVGDGVVDLVAGDRVAYAGPVGSYAEERLIAADRVVKTPDGIDDQTAAAMMLQGMTVRYLLRKTYDVTGDTTLLFHAAAGGVGLIACQWARHLGATLIGTAGSDEKCALAAAHGATHMINYRTENFAARVRELTDGKGCDVVYDSIGQETCPASLECLKPLGLFVSFGAASGPIDSFDLKLLAANGSLFMTRPTLFTYIAARDDLVATANDLFEVVGSGAVKINVNQTYALKYAADAHRDLEGRKTTGSTVLLTG
ncbi:MAG: quinone oxidoreductase family protein [Hyphomicrobiaceae bacterium]